MEYKLEQEKLSGFYSFRSFVEKEFGLNLSYYNESSLQRRLNKVLRHWNLTDLRSLQLLLVRNEHYYQKFVDGFTVQVTELFREPRTLIEIRNQVFPFYTKAKSLKILLVGSSTGEEMSSLCIMLQEEGLLAKSQITATDLSSRALEKAKTPHISKARLAEAHMNYRKSGGKGVLDDYYQTTSSMCYIHPQLFENTELRQFDITQDELGEQFDLIFCRNLLIYFQAEKQHFLLDRLLRHLKPGGFLSLGEQESASFYQNPENLQIISSSQKIYRQNIISV